MFYMIYIGIDPGVKTGLAILSPDEGFFYEGDLETTTIYKALKRVKNTFDCFGEITMVIEDARLRRWFNGGREMLQGAGSIKRDCQIWEEFCEYYSIPLIKVPPKDNKTKLSPEAFAKITGYTKRTSNHARDAAMLVWGRK